MTLHHPDPARRRLIVGSTVLATSMFAVDTTIVNVALPHMRSAMSASQEEIIWIVTSYMIASAIATPLAGWLANRFGRRNLLLIAVGVFTLASAACGLATSLSGAVIARTFQGIAGAGIVPLANAAVLDVTAPENIGKAMATLGLGTMMGPLIGPTLGGWLTETFDWRWVYFINLPLGVLAFAGMAISMYEAKDEKPARFDLFGFASLSILLASFQLILDRGQKLDWWDAPEIWFYSVLVALCSYLLTVHVCTARDTYVRPQLFTDRNFALGCFLSVTVGMVTFATIPLTTVMMQQNLGYTPMLTGLISSPRAVGTAVSMIAIGRHIGKVDNRWFLTGGMVLNAVGLYMLAHINVEVSQGYMVVAGLFQGFGAGLIYPPLSTLVFSTLAPGLRNEGSAMFSLTRSMGSSLGISFLQTQTIWITAAVQSRLSEGFRPDNPAVGLGLPGFDFTAPAELARMHGWIYSQANLVAYLDAYWLIFLLLLSMLPIAMLMRPSGAK